MAISFDDIWNQKTKKKDSKPSFEEIWGNKRGTAKGASDALERFKNDNFSNAEKDIKSYGYGDNTADVYADRYNALSKKAYSAARNAYDVDEGAFNLALNRINNTLSGASSAVDAVNQKKNYFDSFGTREDYDSYIKDIQNSQKARRAEERYQTYKADPDKAKYANDINNLEAKIKSGVKDWQKEGYASERDAKDALSAMKKELNSNWQRFNYEKTISDALNASDYDEKRSEGEKQNNYKIQKTLLNDKDIFGNEELYGYLKGDEKNAYDYYTAKGDKASLDRLNTLLDGELKNRKGEWQSSLVSGNPLLEFPMQFLYGVKSGEEGIKNTVDEMMGRRVFSPDTTSSYISQDLANQGKGYQMVGDALQSIGNMTPSILMSNLGGVFGEIFGLASTTGANVGAMTMYASSAGNAYAEALAEGRTQEEAANYGALTGLSEAFLERLLGGISGIGKNALNIKPKYEQFIVGLDDAIKKVSKLEGVKEFLSSIGSEFVEEALQEYLEPHFKAFVYDEKYTPAELDDIIYAGVLGGLTALGMNGTAAAINVASLKAEENQKINALYERAYGEDSNVLINSAVTDFKDGTKTKAIGEKLKKKYEKGKEISGKDIRKLIKSAMKDDSALSKSGKTEYKGKETEIKKFTESGVELSDGTQTNLSELTFGKYGEESALEAIASVSENLEDVNAIFEVYKNSELSPIEFAAAAEEVYQYGKNNIPNESRNPQFSQKLTEAESSFIENLGRNSVTETVKVVNTVKHGNIYMDADIDMKSLSDVKRESVSAIQVMAQSLTGTEFHLYESVENENGERVMSRDVGTLKKGDIAPNGFYTNGKIYLDVNSGLDGKGYMLYTASHEMVHDIKHRSQKNFNKLRDYLFNSYKKNSVEIDKEIKAKASKLNLSYDEAVEEYVADSLETMLTSTDAIERIARLQTEDKTVWQAIKDFIGKLIARVKSLYEKSDANSAEGRMLKERVSDLKELENLFVEGVKDASESTTLDERIKNQLREDEKIDNAYINAVNNGDMETASKLFKKYILEQADSGIVPILFARDYYKDDHKVIAKKIKSGDDVSLKIAAEAMAEKIPQNAVLIPMPSHTGKSTDTKILAESISEITGNRVEDVLTGVERESQYEIKKTRGKALTPEEMGMVSSKTFSNEEIPIIIDNVIATGVTSSAAVKAVGGGIVLSYAYTHMNNHIRGLKSAEVVTYDDNGNIIPLSKRFNPNSDDIRFQQREGTDNRTILSNALESAVSTSEDAEILKNYKKEIKYLNDYEYRLGAIKSLISAERKNGANKEKIASLTKTKEAIEKHIAIADSALTKMEASKPLQKVLEYERKQAYKWAFEKAEESYKDYKNKRVEKLVEIINRERILHSDKISEIENSYKVRELRAQIHKIKNRIDTKILNNSKTKHVPDNLKKAVVDAISILDTTSKWSSVGYLQYVDKLYEAYSDIQNSTDPDIANGHDAEIEEALKNIKKNIEPGTKVIKMTVGQLEDVVDLLETIEHKITQGNLAYSMKGDKEIMSLSASAAAELLNSSKADFTERDVRLDKVRNFAFDNLKPVHFFEILGSKTLNNAFQGLLDGEGKWGRNIETAKTFLTALSERFNASEWDTDENFVFNLPEGDLKLSLGQIMSMYAYSKRETLYSRDEYGRLYMPHFEVGGVINDRIENIKTKVGTKQIALQDTNPKKIGLSDMVKITSKLSESQKNFVDEMVGFLSTTCSNWGNEVSSKLYGIKLYKEKYYFPLMVSERVLEQKSSKPGEGNKKLKNTGWSNKIISGANKAIMIPDFMNAWAEHVQSMANYNALVLPLEDIERILRFKNPNGISQVERELDRKYSPSARRYLEQLLKDVNGGITADAEANVVNSLISIFKKGATFMSLSTIVQQPTAIFRAWAMIEPKYFVGKPEMSHADAWEQMKKYAPVAIIKEMGYFDTHTGRTGKEALLAKEYKGKDKISGFIHDSGYRDEILSKGASYADEVGWIKIWSACKREARAKGYTGENAFKYAGKRCEDIIRHTQVYDSVLSRSAFLRSKDSGVKMALAFKSEPTTIANMLTVGIIKARRGDKAALGKAVGAVLVSTIINGIAKSLVYAGRDDDEESTYLERYVSEVISSVVEDINPLSLIPYFSEAVSIVKGYDVKRADMQPIADLIGSVQELFKESKTTASKIDGLVGALTNMMGIPYKNLSRDAKGIYNVINEAFSEKSTTIESIKWKIGKDFGDSKYERFIESVRNDSNVEEVISGYVERGKRVGKTEEEVLKSLASQITSEFKPEYIYASDDEKKELKEKLLNIYERLGRDREATSKNIDKWIEAE